VQCSTLTVESGLQSSLPKPDPPASISPRQKKTMDGKATDCLRIRSAPQTAGSTWLPAICLLALGLIACTGPRADLPSKLPDNFQSLEARLEALRTRWKIPGMSAAIAQGGEIIWSRGFGYADVAAGKRATPDTVFHLASLTKPFAAVVLLQLVEEGRLDLDAPVTNYGIHLKSQGIIRVKHLLTHTSEGIPGETYRYNGDRFGQLDKVVTRVTGHSFAAELSRRVLEPLELTNTCPNPESIESCRVARRDPDSFRLRLAQGYNPDGITPVEYKKHFVTAAGLISNIGDLARFSAALDSDALLRPDTRSLGFTPATATSGKQLPYGLGWFVQEQRGLQIFWHYGWWVGDSSLIVKIPERRLTFILLANSDGLSRKFDLGTDNNVRRSPFARAFLKSLDL